MLDAIGSSRTSQSRATLLLLSLACVLAFLLPFVLAFFLALAPLLTHRLSLSEVIPMIARKLLIRLLCLNRIPSYLGSLISPLASQSLCRVVLKAQTLQSTDYHCMRLSWIASPMLAIPVLCILSAILVWHGHRY